MDIWAWVGTVRRQLVEEGQGRLAELLGRLPSDTCDNHHERVDAVYPEALALARARARWNLCR